MKTKLYFLFILLFLSISFSANAEFYQLKIYHISTSKQEARMDTYLEEAYIPAMHRLGINSIGVFKPVATDKESFGKLIYVLTPIQSLDQLLTLPKVLEEDAQYVLKSKDYSDAIYSDAPYDRFETIVLEAFKDAPILKHSNLKNPKSERIYELRSYESQTEKIHLNKVKMFNEGGEVELFDQLGFNAVFYGAVISGSSMPNLMYLTTFADMESRNTHWESFNDSPVWAKLKVDPEYQNNVSKNTIYFLTPTEYSDL